jgi:VacB/RNase II family 3'-5' exoribonuclease
MMKDSDLTDNGFQRIRDELKVPREFPAPVLAEAEAAARRDPLETKSAGQYEDLRVIPFVTIDPPGSRDLDQAYFAARTDAGYTVRYAIADVGFFVERGGAIEEEAWRRGETLYSPDLKTPLYPSVLSEGGASLLPDALRPAIVFTFTLDNAGYAISEVIASALVQSRTQLAYPEVSRHLTQEREQKGSGGLAGNEWSESLDLLEEIGRKRQKIEAGRGGVSLRIPEQQVERWSTAVTGYRLAFETSTEVEEWNAQISLMTGIAAARVMIGKGLGLLRALDPPRPDRVRALRLTASALGVNWPATTDYDDFVRGLDPLNPTHAVLLHQAARVTGGARYVAFEGEPPPHSMHSAIAAPYAHTTAPLRRLADRYVLDLLIAFSKENMPTPEFHATLFRLPQVMAESDNLARRLESAIVDYAEAWLMQDRIGQVFNAVVIALRMDGVVVQISDPPIRTLIPLTVFAPSLQVDGQMSDQPKSKNNDKPHAILSEDGSALEIGAQHITLGQTLSLRLESADRKTRSLGFSLAPEG